MTAVPIVVDIQVFVGAVSSGNFFPPFPAVPPKSNNPFADTLSLIENTGYFSLWLSDHITHHIELVLTRDYGWDATRAREFVDIIVDIAQESGGGVVQTTARVADCPDYEDNRILELAAEVKSPLIISDDYHLTDMNPWYGPAGEVAISTPKDFRDSVSAKIQMLKARRK